MIAVNVGEIWCMREPHYHHHPGRVSHLLVIDRREDKRYGILCTVMYLQTGKIVDDFIFDTANVQNYRMELVL